MAAPGCAWLAFGFSPEEAAGEPGPGPGPWRLEAGPGGISRLWPAWSYVVVETGAGLELRSAGQRRRLPGWAEALPSETHLVLRGAAGTRAWRRAAALSGALRGEPAWSRDELAGSRDEPAGSRDEPTGSRDEPAGSRDEPTGSRDEPTGSQDEPTGTRDEPAGSRDEPARSRDEPAEPRQPLPLLPGGFATPRPPFFTALPAGLRARRLVLGTEHVLALGAGGEVFSWGGGRHGQLGHGQLESELQPRLLEALAGVPMREVAAGGWHSASVSEAGDLYVWGWNESGQLALPSKALAAERAQAEDAGTGSPGLTPCREQLPAQDAAFISIQAFPALLDLPRDPEVSAVSCGSRHTAAVTRGGELYTWGWGKYGQLGHGNSTSSDQARRVEQLVAEGLRVEEVVCGPWTTYVRVREP